MRNLRRLLRIYKFFIIYVVIGFIALIGIGWVIIPQIRETVSLVKRLRDEQKTLTGLTNKIQILNSTDEQSLSNDLNTLFSAVPKEKSFSTIFSQIETTAFEQKLSVESIVIGQSGLIATEAAKPKNPEEQKLGANLVPVNIVVSGEFDNIRNFLDRVVKIRRFFRVRLMSISFVEKSSIVRATLALDVFYLPLPKYMGKVTDPISALSDQETAVMVDVEQMPLVGGENVVNEPSNSEEPVTANPFAP